MQLQHNDRVVVVCRKTESEEDEDYDMEEDEEEEEKITSKRGL